MFFTDYTTGHRVALGEGSGARTYYCGQYFGTTALPGTDGHCGPDDGSNCASCKRFERANTEVIQPQP